MDKEIIEEFQGSKVKITIGIRNFVPPPGYIIKVTDNYIVYQTSEKTSVIALSEVKEITPV